MRRFEIVKDWRKEKPNRWLVAVFLIFIVTGTAYADQADDDFHTSHGDIKGANGWQAPGNPTDADIAAMRAEWDRKAAAAEASRLAFIAKGDFSPAAGAALYTKTTGNPVSVQMANGQVKEFDNGNVAELANYTLTPQGFVKQTGGGTTLLPSPVTLDGTPVGLSGFSEPTPPTPTLQPNSSNDATAKQSAEAVKVEVVKTPEIPKPKTLVSYESKRKNGDQK